MSHETVDDFLNLNEGESEPLPRYRANANLAMSPDLVEPINAGFSGYLYCRAGDITELYWPLRKYPDRINLLIGLGAIERMPDMKARPILNVKKPKKADIPEGEE